MEVGEFKYLGSKITRYKRCKCKIRGGIAQLKKDISTNEWG